MSFNLYNYAPVDPTSSFQIPGLSYGTEASTATQNPQEYDPDRSGIVGVGDSSQHQSTSSIKKECPSENRDEHHDIKPNKGYLDQEISRSESKQGKRIKVEEMRRRVREAPAYVPTPIDKAKFSCLTSARSIEKSNRASVKSEIVEKSNEWDVNENDEIITVRKKKKGEIEEQDFTMEMKNRLNEEVGEKNHEDKTACTTPIVITLSSDEDVNENRSKQVLDKTSMEKQEKLKILLEQQREKMRKKEKLIARSLNTCSMSFGAVARDVRSQSPLSEISNEVLWDAWKNCDFEKEMKNDEYSDSSSGNLIVVKNHRRKILYSDDDVLDSSVNTQVETKKSKNHAKNVYNTSDEDSDVFVRKNSKMRKNRKKRVRRIQVLESSDESDLVEHEAVPGNSELREMRNEPYSKKSATVLTSAYLEKMKMEEKKKRKRLESQRKREEKRDAKRVELWKSDYILYKSHWKKQEELREVYEREKALKKKHETIPKEDVGKEICRKVVDAKKSSKTKPTTSADSDSPLDYPPAPEKKRIAHQNPSNSKLPPRIPTRKRPLPSEQLAKAYKEAEERKKREQLELEKKRAKKFQTQEELYGQSSSRIGSAAKGENRQARTSNFGNVFKKTIKSEPVEERKREKTPVPPQVLEPASQKIPLKVRSHMMKAIFNELYTKNPNTAIDEAKKMELELMQNAISARTYQVNCGNAVARIRKALNSHVIPVASKVVSHEQVMAGRNFNKISVGINRRQNIKNYDTMPENELYDEIQGLRMTSDQLKENGYPLYLDDQLEKVVISPTQYDANKKIWIERIDNKRTCCRCNREFKLNEDGSIRKEKAICRYHNRGTNVQGKKQTFVKRHPCCGEEFNTSPGCKLSDTHVFDQIYVSELEVFVPTPKSNGALDTRNKKIFALDCEMVYTMEGPALARLSVVDVKGEMVLDVLVKPPGEVLDANTEFSGLTMDEINSAKDSLDSCRQKLFKLVNENTILIGHSLESDLKAMRIVHRSVIDTALLYSNGPFKKSLKTLASTHLKRFIQSDNDENAGHCSFEDAKVCMDLVLHLLKNPVVSRISRM